MPVSSFPRLLIVTLIVAVCFACTGCGGGGGGSSSGGSTPSYLTLPALSATVPTAAGGPSVRGDLRGQVSASEYSVTIVNPEDGSTLKTITATSIAAAGNNLTINFGSNITVVAPSKGVIKLVVARLSVAILHGYVSSPLPEAGETKTTPAVDVGSDDLAKALAFEEWNTRYAAGTFDNFVNQVENEFTFENKLASLTEKIETTLITLVTGDEPPAAFSWETVDAVKTLADDFKDVAAPPTTGGVGIPANIQIAGFVASPATQVRCAIESILNLANVGLPTKVTVAGSIAPATPALPPLTPVLGSNQAIDIAGLRNLLMTSLQGGSSATEGPIGALTTDASKSQEISYTPSSVEIIYKGYSGYPPVEASRGRQLVEGVEVTAENGVITQVKFGADAKFTNEIIDTKTGAVETRTTFRLVSGISGVAIYHKESQAGNNVISTPWGGSYSFVYTHKGYQKMDVAISGPIVIEATTENLQNGIKAGGKVTLNGATGTIVQTNPFYYGHWSFAPGATLFCYTQESSVSDTLTFSGNALALSVTAESTTNDVYLKELSLNLSGIIKIASGEYAGDYKIGSVSGKAVAVYNGTSYKDYGYIKQLEVLISNVAFDPTTTPQVADGALITLNKTNSDNTVDTLTYTIINGKPVLSGSTNFQGGDAAVTTADGNVKFTGTITFQDPTAKKMVMDYEATCLNAPESDEGLIATATMTIGTTKRIITYKYSNPRNVNDGFSWSRVYIDNGKYMDENKNSLGIFKWYESYRGLDWVVVWNTVYSTDIADWQNFQFVR